MTKRQSDLSGFRGWTNPDRFISEIEILVEELAAARAEIKSLRAELLSALEGLEAECGPDDARSARMAELRKG